MKMMMIMTIMMAFDERVHVIARERTTYYFWGEGGAPLRSILFAKHNVARLNGRSTRCVFRSSVAIVVLCDMHVHRLFIFYGLLFPSHTKFVACGGQLIKHLSTTQKVGSIFSS